MSEVLIIGIGNPFRGDDGAGWAVIDALQGKVAPRVKLCKQRGDIAELIDAFSSHANVYIVDACSTEASVGSWQRFDAHRELPLLNKPETSTHGLSIKEAIAFAKNLDQLPPKLIIYAISAKQFTIGSALSAAVVKAVDQVAQEILKEVSYA